MESNFFDFLQFEIINEQKVIMKNNCFIIEETDRLAKLKKINLVSSSKYDVLCIKLDNMEKQIGLLKNKILSLSFLILLIYLFLL